MTLDCFFLSNDRAGFSFAKRNFPIFNADLYYRLHWSFEILARADKRIQEFFGYFVLSHLDGICQVGHDFVTRRWL